MNGAWIGAAVVAPLVGVVQPAVSPTATVTALIERAESQERAGLARAGSGEYATAKSALDAARRITIEASQAIRAGVTAGSIGAGLAPTATGNAVNDLSAASVDVIEAEFALRHPSETAAHQVEVDVTRALALDVKAIALLTPKGAVSASPTGSCMGFIGTGFALGRVDHSVVRFGCSLSGSVSARYDLVITLVQEAPGSPRLFAGGLVKSPGCSTRTPSSANQVVCAVVGPDAAGTHRYQMAWDDVVNGEVGPTCNTQVLVTVAITAAGAASKQIASQTVMLNC